MYVICFSNYSVIRKLFLEKPECPWLPDSLVKNLHTYIFIVYSKDTKYYFSN
jgi:hypothetical protein